MKNDMTCLLVGSPDIRIIDATGKEWTFEMHYYCGPVMKREPGPRSPFWSAVTRWVEGGRRMDGDLCVWEPQKPERIIEVVRGFCVSAEGDPRTDDEIRAAWMSRSPAI